MSIHPPPPPSYDRHPPIGTDRWWAAPLIAVIVVAVVVLGDWGLRQTEPPAPLHAECPPGYVFTPRQTWGGNSWCIDGDRAQQPTYTRQERNE